LPGFAIVRFFPVPEKPAHPPEVQRSTWLCPATVAELCAGQRKPQKQQNFALLSETCQTDPADHSLILLSLILLFNYPMPCAESFRQGSGPESNAKLVPGKKTEKASVGC
jgi:hypothetical protein